MSGIYTILIIDILPKSSIDNPKNSGWDQKINLWISVESMEEVDNMLLYYSTLKKK
ncbi:hypothetical protein AGMMS50229_16110 [Campylobacterota bacterium]|nr:hypothetical protein AGMMS50229_16110 [Campylobacterota bacterium]